MLKSLHRIHGRSRSRFFWLLATALFFAPGLALAQGDLTCGDTFVDTGGPDEPYADNEDYVVNICPTEGTDEVVTVTFTAFDLEEGFDVLGIFDGFNGSGGLRDILTGNEIPGPFTSAAGGECLAFRFISDGSVQGAGFVADVTCGAGPVCPAPFDPELASATDGSVTVEFSRRGVVTAVEAELGALGFQPGTGAAIATVTNADVDSSAVVFDGLDPVTEYEVYLRNDCDVGGFGAGQTEWVGPIAVETRTSPPTYDECAGAQVVTMQALGEECETVSLTSLGATSSGGESNFDASDDIWIAFEATGPSFEMIFTSEDEETPLGAVILELFDECGGEPIEGFISEEIGEPLPFSARLTLGDTYRVRVITEDADDNVQEIDFGVCLRAYETPTCGDVFTDRGGEDGDYATDEDYSVTVCPTEGTDEVVTVTFTEFATEANFDVLSVFEGSSADGEVFAEASGTEIPGPFTSAAEDGCLTFTFSSDGSVVDAGWRADVTCGPALDCPAPTGLAFADEADLTTTSATISFRRRTDSPTIVAELGVPGFTPGAGDALETATVSGGDTSFVQFADLTPATEYEIYVRSDCEATGGTGQSVFEGPFVFQTRPGNDECADATLLTMAAVSGDCEVVSLTTKGATASGGPSRFQPAEEIFVTFVATAPYFSTELTGTNEDDALDFYAIEVFEDCVAGPIGDYATGQLGAPVARPIELTVGETYVVSIVTLESTFFGAFVSEADFDFCIRAFDAPPASANDDCANPAILVDEAGVVTSASGATYSSFLGEAAASIPAEACGDFTGTADDDLFFQVTVPSVGDSVTVTAQGSGDLVMIAYEPGVCQDTSIAQVTCSDATFDGGVESVTLGSTVEGQTYVIQVFSWGNGPRDSYAVLASVKRLVGLGTLPQGRAFEVYPNPTSPGGSLTVVLPEAVADAQATLTVTDVTGRPLHRRSGIAGQRNVTLEPQGLAAGVYFVSLDAEGARSTQRIIVE